MATNSVFEKKKRNEARSINVFLLSIILVRGRLETLCRDNVLTQRNWSYSSLELLVWQVASSSQVARDH